MKPFASALNRKTPRRLALGVAVLGGMALLLGGGCHHVRQRCGLLRPDRNAQARRPSPVVNAGYCETRWVSFTPTCVSDCVQSYPSELTDFPAAGQQSSLPLPQPIRIEEATLDSPTLPTQSTQAVEFGESTHDIGTSMNVEVLEHPGN